MTSAFLDPMRAQRLARAALHNRGEAKEASMNDASPMQGRPKRIQLSRQKGWRMPPGAVKVDRSTKWGNPWPVGEFGPLLRFAPDPRGALGLFEAMLRQPEMRAAAGYPDDLSPLRGRDLACWCPLNSPCHADALLRAANYGASKPAASYPAVASGGAAIQHEESE